MALQAIANISVDFYDKKYISINSKQLDRKTRFLSVTCYSHGDIFHLNSGEHAAYIRYRKPDGHCVFNFCKIDNKGKILVELTEQMLAIAGICYTDLVVVNKGSAVVDKNTGEIVTIDDAGILSTMPFYVNVFETTFENSVVESSYEYDGLNELLERAEADYTEVVLTSKSWAVGDTGVRKNENTDNAKYYSKQASTNSNNAEASAQRAFTSEVNASMSAIEAKSYAIGEGGNRNREEYDNAKYYYQQSLTNANNTKINADNAETSASRAMTSEVNASMSEKYAKSYAIGEGGVRNREEYDNAKYYYQQSLTNANEVKTNAQQAMTSEVNASMSEAYAKSYAIGEGGVRNREEYDNARYYCEMARSIVEGINSAFVPMGTIAFAELATIEKSAGFTYNINDDFITDDTFREGAGKPYNAGTNVYYTADGYWDCFGGSASPIATVDEVKSYLGI